MKNSFVVFLFFFSMFGLYAKDFFQGFQMGMSSKEIQSISKDISNPNSWEETEFEIQNPLNMTIFGEKPKKSRFTFYHDRIYKVYSVFERQDFDLITNHISTILGKPDPKDIDLNAKDRSIHYYGEFKDYKYSYIINIYEISNETILTYTEEAQKDFRITDLFKGSLVWILLTILGMFVLYLIFGYLVTSYCSNCKTFNLNLTGKKFQNPKDYDPSLFGRDVHWDEIYHFSCKKCGFEKDDVYSGYWSWYHKKRNQ